MAGKDEKRVSWLYFSGALVLVVLITLFSLELLHSHLLVPGRCTPVECENASGVVLPLIALLFGWLVIVVVLMGVAVKTRPWR